MAKELHPGADPAAGATTTTWISVSHSFYILTALLIALLFLAVIYLSHDDVVHLIHTTGNNILPPPATELTTSSSEQCDMFSGRWVYDNVSYPLYKEQECKFMSDQEACQKFGRKDVSYQHWWWHPHNCHLPRFNGTAMLEKLRNKRMVFVGDSLNRGQWVSMLCLIQSSIADTSLTSMDFRLKRFTFKAREYNASIDFYWEPFLVESNCDIHTFPNRTIRVQAIEKHGRKWSDADILVFDTYHWWRKYEMINVVWGSFDDPDSIYKNISAHRALEMALGTWADWLEIHVNRTKTQIFFMSSSPRHMNAEDWGGTEGKTCYQETELITNQGYRAAKSNPKIMQIVESVVKSLETRGVVVKIMNITPLSEYRKDAHPTIHRKFWKVVTEEEKANPVSYADCTHWCLPGVPDVWNVLLYAHIL